MSEERTIGSPRTDALILGEIRRYFWGRLAISPILLGLGLAGWYVLDRIHSAADAGTSVRFAVLAARVAIAIPSVVLVLWGFFGPLMGAAKQQAMIEKLNLPRTTFVKSAYIVGFAYAASMILLLYVAY